MQGRVIGRSGERETAKATEISISARSRNGRTRRRMRGTNAGARGTGRVAATTPMAAILVGSEIARRWAMKPPFEMPQT